MTFSVVFSLILAASVVLAIFTGYRAQDQPVYMVMWRVGTMLFFIVGISWDGHPLPWMLLAPLAYVMARAYSVERAIYTKR